MSRNRSRARARRLYTFASDVNSRSAISAALNPHSVLSARANWDSRGIASSQQTKSIRSRSSATSPAEYGGGVSSPLPAPASTSRSRIRSPRAAPPRPPNPLGLDKGPVRRAGRRHDRASRFELPAHIQDTVLELLLPRVEGGEHLLHLCGGGPLRLPGRAPLEEQVVRHRVSPMGMRRSEWPAFQRRARVRRLDTAGIQGVSIFSVPQDARKCSA